MIQSRRTLLSFVCGLVSGICLLLTINTVLQPQTHCYNDDVMRNALQTGKDTDDRRPSTQHSAAGLWNSSCIYTWTAYADRHVVGGRLHMATSVVDCQSACVNDTRCVGVDFNSARQCFVLLSADTLNQTEKVGCVHYDLYRTCGDGVDDDSEAQRLYQTVRILCLVMTTPEHHMSRVIHVQATWARRCNLMFFVSENDLPGLPVVLIDVKSGRDFLTGKMLKAFDYIYQHHRHEAEWFLKADDDTYVILENLRYFLSSKDTTQPVYFGHEFVHGRFDEPEYVSGGAGYVLSKEALTRLANRKSGECLEKWGVEDYEIGLCLSKLGVIIGESRDVYLRDQFNVFNPEGLIRGKFLPWYPLKDKYGAKAGIEAMSDYAITFHYILTQHMYNLEFYIYHLRPYGIRPRVEYKESQTAANS